MGLSLLARFLLDMLKFVEEADDVRLILCDPRWHRGILKGDRGAHFRFVLRAQFLDPLKLHADIPGLVDILTFGWKAESDVLDVVIGESIDKAEEVLGFPPLCQWTPR